MNALRKAAATARKTIVQTTVVVGSLAAVVEVTTHLPSQGRSSPMYHTVCDKIVLPMLKWLDPETAHDVSIQGVRSGWAPIHPRSVADNSVDLSATVSFPHCDATLRFSNPIGLAAGYDKHGEAMRGLYGMGFGSVEIGTVTLQAQPGNVKPRLFRLVEDHAIINRYGFNSVGAQTVVEHMEEFTHPPYREPTLVQKLWKALYGSRDEEEKGVLGINIGKNKATDADDLHAVVSDYTQLIQKLGPYADYLVINVSSPNTAGLRNLQHPDNLKHLLTACLEARDALSGNRQRPPVLVKLAPDLSDDELQQIADICILTHIDGVIVINTTNQRPVTLQSKKYRQETGGLSGAPLKDLSTTMIRKLYQMTDGTLPIIGVGGISSGQDVYDKLKAGASVVQLYTSLVYGGPGLVTRIRLQFSDIMKLNGHQHVSDIVGLDHEDLYWKKKRAEAKTPLLNDSEASG